MPGGVCQQPPPVAVRTPNGPNADFRQQPIFDKKIHPIMFQWLGHFSWAGTDNQWAGAAPVAVRNPHGPNANFRPQTIYDKKIHPIVLQWLGHFLCAGTNNQWAGAAPVAVRNPHGRMPISSATNVRQKNTPHRVSMVGTFFMGRHKTGPCNA